MRNTEYTALKGLFSRVFEIDPSNITPDLQYKQIPEWDSITHMFLIDEIEKTFEIQIASEDILQMRSFNMIIDTLKKYRVTIS